MAYRNFWTIQNNKIVKGIIEFKWESGISTSQKRRSCAHLHSALNQFYDLYPVLDISSASTEVLGTMLSAFNLKWRGVPIECWYQGSKVYENKGPMHELYKLDSLTAKMSMKQPGLGKLIGFNLEGEEFPVSPKTVFYDFLYLQGLLQFGRRDEILQYEAFTDVQAVLDIDACQARTVCIYKLLCLQGKLNVLQDFNDFKKWHMEYVEDLYVPEKEYNEDIRYVSDNCYKVLDVKLSEFEKACSVNHKHVKQVGSFVQLTDKPKYVNPEVIIYTDLLLDDLCAIELLSNYYSSAVILAVNSGDLNNSDYAPSGYNLLNAADDINEWFHGNAIVVRDKYNMEDICDLRDGHSVDVYCLSNATAIIRDLTYLQSNLGKLTAMIGSSHIYNPADNEWNAAQDLVSYNTLQSFINTNTNCLQVTAGECEDYATKSMVDYSYLKYYNVYIHKMKSLNDNTCCYDLRAVEYSLKLFNLRNKC